MAPLGVKEQGRAKRPAVWGGAARPATQAADASRGGGEAGDREGAESSWSGREGEVPTAEDGAHGRSSDDVKGLNKSGPFILNLALCSSRTTAQFGVCHFWTFSRPDLRSNP
ncbi:hypothetical protein VPH35_059661 [Triticum aestivum]|uniref:Uncharacterized protein n=1 Tax=Aegilops tauschii TaxID=37682 RepID=M8BVQ8_AEGTA